MSAAMAEVRGVPGPDSRTRGRAKPTIRENCAGYRV